MRLEVVHQFITKNLLYKFIRAWNKVSAIENLQIHFSFIMNIHLNFNSINLNNLILFYTHYNIQYNVCICIIMYKYICI